MSSDSTLYWQGKYDQASADVARYAGYKNQKPRKKRKAWKKKYKAAKKARNQADKQLKRLAKLDAKTERVSERNDPEVVAAKQQKQQALIEQGGELLGDVATMVGSAFGADVDALADAPDVELEIEDEEPAELIDGVPNIALLAGAGIAGLGAWLILRK